MMRRKGFDIPDGDGGMEDANEQELEKLVRESGELFDNDNADGNGDKTQDLSAVFIPREEKFEFTEELKESSLSANALPIAAASEDTYTHEDEESLDEETVSAEAERVKQPPPTKSTGNSKKTGGGIYVAVIAVCLLLSLWLLVINSREAEPPQTENSDAYSEPSVDTYDGTATPPTVTAEEIYHRQKSSSVTVCIYSENGAEYLSGTVIWDDGFVVTVCGDIPDAKRVEIVSANGKNHAVEIIGYDTTADIALLKCDADGLVPIERQDAAMLGAGTRLYAIGTAEDARFGGSLFEGVVSFEERTVEIFRNGDNTRRAVTVGVGGLSCDTLLGSPVYDQHGRAIAMLWGGTEGDIGLVVPMERVLAVAEFFKNGEIPDKSTLACIAYGTPSLGVIGENYSDNGTFGVLIKDFISPVCDAALKLRRDDVIVAINEAPAIDTQTVKQTVYGFRSGDVVEIHVLRDAQLLSFFVKLD